MSTAFVLSGGAALGAAQVGMLKALNANGITPDLIVGASVGAINGGWIAGDGGAVGLAGLEYLWKGLHRSDVFPARPLPGLMGFLGHRRNLVPNSGLRSLLTDHLRFKLLEEASIPLHVIVTDVLSGEDVRMSTGPAVETILASASIPAVFPPVRLGDRYFVDGGVLNNTPISHAVALGADTIWVLPTGYACALSEPPRGALAMALHALTLTINQRLAVDVARYEGHVDLRVVPPLCPVRSSPADFSQADDLIERTYLGTSAWLSSRHPTAGQAGLLLHPHRH